ncbi:MAG: Ig-like domain-containing protein [Isosphaeraceae bacterium]
MMARQGNRSDSPSRLAEIRTLSPRRDLSRTRRRRSRPQIDVLESRITPTIASPYNAWYSDYLLASGLSGATPQAMTVDPATRTIYYATSDTGGMLYRIDPSTGASSLVRAGFSTGGSISGFYPYVYTDLEFDRGSIYTVTSGGELLKIDALTGATSKLTTFTGIGTEAGIAIVGDKLYVTDGSGSANDLREFDLITGITTVRATNIGSSAYTLEYDSLNNRLVFGEAGGSTYRSFSLSNSSQYNLFFSNDAYRNFAVDPTGRYAYQAAGSAVLRFDLLYGNVSTFATYGTTLNDVKFGPSSTGLGTSLYTVTSANQLIEIRGFNSAPILASGSSVPLPVISEDPTTNPGTTVASLLATLATPIIDSDPNPQKGIAVYSAGSSIGTWQYSTNGGSSWLSFDAGGSLSSSSALLLAGDARVRFVPTANSSGSASFGFVAWDRAPMAEGYGTFPTTSGSRAPVVFLPAGPFSYGTGTAYQVVNAVNDAPSFVKGPNLTYYEDWGLINYSGWASSLNRGAPNEVGQTLSFEVSTDNPALFSVAPSINSSGTLTFRSAPDAFGTANVTVVLRDNGGTANGGQDSSAPQTFQITINPVNDPPSFSRGPNQNVLEDPGPQTVVGWATSISAGPANESNQGLTFQIGVSDPSFFSVQPSVSASGTLTYTIAPNRWGYVTVYVSLTDDGGTAFGGQNSSETTYFTISVTDVNDAPSFVKGPDVTVAEDSGWYSYWRWASGGSPGPYETYQGYTYLVSTDNPSLFASQPTIDYQGTLQFLPAPNAYGTATVTVTLKDTGGTANGGQDTSAPQTFTITILPVNDAPSFTMGSAPVVDEDAGPQALTGWASAISPGPDNESDQTLEFIVTVDNPSLFAVLPAVSPDGTLTFTPAPDANGLAAVSIVLKDSGGILQGGSDSTYPRSFAITVNAVNDAPTIDPISNVLGQEDAPTQTTTLTGITPGPANEAGQAISVSVSTDRPDLIGTPTVTSVSPNGTATVSYTPVANASGTATVTVSVTDHIAGTPRPLTGEVQVNSTVEGVSLSLETDRTIAVDALGNTVIVWQAWVDSAGDWDIYARRYFPDGTPNGSEFRVNTSTGGTQTSPTVAMAANGRFVVVWDDLQTSQVLYQLYDADGSAVGG